jgi:hypothetical protein
MSLLSTIRQAVQSLRRRRGTTRSRRRSELLMEQLDHRQLLAVNFTGNVTNDFTAATPAVYLTDPNNLQPLIPPPLQNIVKVSGFAVDQIAVNYDQATDTLSLGYLQPPSQKFFNGLTTQFPVIAGDADNNGNNTTTDPAAAALGVLDDPAISLTENFNAVIDLSGGTNTATQSIFAGIPNSATPGYTNSTYVVAPAVFTAGTIINSAIPQAGAELTGNEGNLYMPFNDPRHGALEYSITHFSTLYFQVTGKVLSPTSVISIGASAGSGDDDGISEEIFHFQPLTIINATTPTPTPPPPPTIIEVFQPTILINPHENRHINTAHYTNIRVTVLSSSSFAATQINPSTVTLNGAPPISWFPRMVLGTGFVSETFVFKGTDVNLPPGFTVATIQGQTFSGQTFTSSQIIFNRNDSFYSAAQIASRDRRLARLGIPVAQESGTTAAVASAMTPAAATPAALSVPIPLDTTVGSTNTVKLTPRQQYQANAAARKAALYSTVAASSFQGSGTTSSSSSSTSSQAALLAHDLALQSLVGGSQSAA